MLRQLPPGRVPLALTRLDGVSFREAQPGFLGTGSSAAKPPLIALGALWAFPDAVTDLGCGYLGTMLPFSVLSCTVPAG